MSFQQILHRVVVAIRLQQRAEFLVGRFRIVNSAQILEFIDMEHTPKNLLIRAVKRQEGSKKLPEELKVCMEAYHVKPTLADLLTEKEEP